MKGVRSMIMRQLPLVRGTVVVFDMLEWHCAVAQNVSATACRFGSHCRYYICLL
jgi:hypothetical protein